MGVGVCNAWGIVRSGVRTGPGRGRFGAMDWSGCAVWTDDWGKTGRGGRAGRSALAARPGVPMPRRLPAFAALLAVLAAAGCAMFAKKAPTPANEIAREALARSTPPPGERYYVFLFGSQ